MCDNKPMAPYAKLPELEEYKEWFKDFADLYREDGIASGNMEDKRWPYAPQRYVSSCHRSVSKSSFS